MKKLDALRIEIPSNEMVSFNQDNDMNIIAILNENRLKGENPIRVRIDRETLKNGAISLVQDLISNALKEQYEEKK